MNVNTQIRKAPTPQPPPYRNPGREMAEGLWKLLCWAIIAGCAIYLSSEMPGLLEGLSMR